MAAALLLAPIAPGNTGASLAAARPAADLVITMIATPLNVPVGGRIQYRLAVTNQGPDLATGVVVTDPLPAGLTFVSATSTQGTCALAAQQTLRCELGSLVVGQTEIIQMIVTTTRTGEFLNGATVNSETPDPNFDNNVAIYPSSSGVRLPQETPGECAIDQTRAVLVQRGMLTYNRNTRRYLQQVHVGNIARQPISGPVWLVLDGLAPVVLTNADGETSCRAPLGSPYIQLNVGADGVLRPQEDATVTLSFAIPAGSGLRYQTRLLTGTGER